MKRLNGKETQVEFASLATVFLNLGATGLRWLITVFLTNWLGAGGFGAFSALRGWAGLLSRLPNQGFDLALIRWLPKYRDAKDTGSYRALLRHATRITGVSAIVLAIGVALFGWINGGQSMLAVVAGAVLIVTGAVGTLLRQELQAANRHVFGVWLTEVTHPVIFGALALLAALFFDADNGVGAVLAALAIAGVVVVVAEFITIARNLPNPDAETAESIPEQATEVLAGSGSDVDRETEWRSGTSSLFLAQLGLAALEISYLLIISATLGNVAAGIFGVANRIALMARLGNTAVETILSPEFGRLSAQEDGGLAELQQVVDKGIRLAMLFTSAALFVLLVAADLIISVFGDGFDDAKPVLIMLLIGTAINAFTGPTGYLVSMTGSEVAYGYIMAGHAAVGAALAFIIAQSVGTVVAVALVSSLVTVSWNVCLIVIGGRRLGVWCLPPLVRRALGLATPKPVG